VAPVGEKEEFVSRAIRNIAEYLPRKSCQASKFGS